MSATLANATTVLKHLNSVPPVRGYTPTLHHVWHLSPGDLWRPVDGERPRTVIVVRRSDDRIIVTDQYGATFAYSAVAIIPTAVPDPFPLGGRAGQSRNSRLVPPRNGSVTWRAPA